MQWVLLAMAPGVLIQVWVQGIGVLVQIVIAVMTALACEAAVLRWRGLTLRPFITDGTAVVGAVLFAVAMPADAAWWLGVLGASFAIVVAKHAYGGVGCNVFNPAMAGYALLLVGFPHTMKAGGLPADASTALSNIFVLTPQVPVDAISGATVLETVRSGLQSMSMLSEIAGAHDVSPFGNAGVGWINLGFLAGGLVLLGMKVIRWQIPVGFLAGMAIVSTLLHVGDPDRHASAVFHLFSGATMLGAFFIATDPVSSPVSARGRLIFGLCAGALTLVIRRFGLYPDGVAFAVLIMNAAAPVIDRLTRPRVLGEPPS
jgi:electron transport complex protein RnfD